MFINLKDLSVKITCSWEYKDDCFNFYFEKESFLSYIRGYDFKNQCIIVSIGSDISLNFHSVIDECFYFKGYLL